MFIVCLTIFFSILSPLQAVSYVKVHVYCVFDYFLFNLVSTSGRWVTWKCMFIVCLTTFSSLQFQSWKCMFIVCLTIFSLITSGGELRESEHVYCVFDYFLFNLVSTSVGELRESACLLCVWLFSLQSCLHFSRWVTWKCMFIVCLTIFSSILSPLQSVSYVKVHVYCVFDYFLFNFVSTSAVSYMKVHVDCVFDYFLFNLVYTSGGWVM